MSKEYSSIIYVIEFINSCIEMLLVFEVLFVFNPRFVLILLALSKLTNYMEIKYTVLRFSMLFYKALAFSAISESVFKFSSLNWFKVLLVADIYFLIVNASFLLISKAFIFYGYV